MATNTMARAIFTPATREGFIAGAASIGATLVDSVGDHDRYVVGECHLTVCFRVEPGDFVSRQVLGCHNAVRTGQLECANREAALTMVSKTYAVIGIVGPDIQVAEVADTLTSHVKGVIVSPTEAILVS